MQISVEISELKRVNDIAAEIASAPVDQNAEGIPQKVDNDLESSDLEFSEKHEPVDEHAYQIGELGKFEAEKSSSDEADVMHRDDTSVDFSDGPGGLSMDMDSEASQKAEYNDSSFSSQSANQMSDESNSFYSSSLPNSSVDNNERDEDYEWEKFVKEEERKYGKPAEKPRAANQEPPAPAAPESVTDGSTSGDAVSNLSSSSSSLSSSSSSSSSSSTSSQAKANGIGNHLVPKKPKLPVEPVGIWRSSDQLQNPGQMLLLQHYEHSNYEDQFLQQESN